MKYIVLVLIGIIFSSCIEEKVKCDNYIDMNSSEIEYFLTYKVSSEKLHHQLYILGECKIVDSIPYLIKSLKNRKITHDIRHKGMSIRYIANKALVKITNKDFSFNMNDTEEEKIKSVQRWKTFYKAMVETPNTK